ncbi:MAG: hypothetical protein ABIH53_00375 [archaeon]
MKNPLNILIGVVVVVIITFCILGLIHLFDKQADNTREFMNKTNPEITGKTIYEAGQEISLVWKSTIKPIYEDIHIPLTIIQIIDGVNSPTDIENETSNQSEI